MAPTGPTALTFSSLSDALDSYVERGSTSDAEYIAQRPQIINRAERSLADKLKIQGYLDVLSSTFADNVAIIAKPDGWRDTVSWRIGVNSTNNPPQLTRNQLLRYRSFEVLSLYAPDRSMTGTPIFYADYDFYHWIVGPTPDQAYPYELVVHRLPPLLSPSNEQNYLTDLTPNLLLYECLLHLEPFLKDDARAVTWKLLRDEELEAVNSQEVNKFIDRTLSRKIP